MLNVSNLSVQFGKRILFDEVNTSFVKGNCYGIIGANGAGKSTFLKILSKSLEPNSGNVSLEPGKRMSVLEQNHFAFDDKQVLETVIMGNKDLFLIKKEMDEIYAKPDFSDKDSDRVGVLQLEYEEMDGWNAESSAAALLSNLEIKEENHHRLMSELDGIQKVKVLLAQALFGNPDVLIMDEPTNDLDIETLDLLQELLCEFDGTILLISHDRDFVERVATRVLFFEGNGRIIDFTGGYESYLNNFLDDKNSLDVAVKSRKPKNTMNLQENKKSAGLSFTEQHRLSEIPEEIDRLELEIKKLEEFLSIDDLYRSDQKKFDKASIALAERKLKMDKIMEEWLLLEDKQNYGQLS